jgi:hypothetical protein
MVHTDLGSGARLADLALVRSPHFTDVGSRHEGRLLGPNWTRLRGRMRGTRLVAFLN